MVIINSFSLLLNIISDNETNSEKNFHSKTLAPIMIKLEINHLIILSALIFIPNSRNNTPNTTIEATDCSGSATLN